MLVGNFVLHFVPIAPHSVVADVGHRGHFLTCCPHGTHSGLASQRQRLPQRNKLKLTEASRRQNITALMVPIKHF